MSGPGYVVTVESSSATREIDRQSRALIEASIARHVRRLRLTLRGDANDASGAGGSGVGSSASDEDDSAPTDPPADRSLPIAIPTAPRSDPRSSSSAPYQHAAEKHVYPLPYSEKGVGYGAFAWALERS